MKNIIILVFLITSTSIFSQKLKIIDGDIKNLKGISEYNLEFDYTNVQVPKFDSEEDFLADKMKKREEKEAGGGENSKNHGIQIGRNSINRNILNLSTIRFKNKEIALNKNKSDAEHTMKIHSTLIYAGFNVGAVRQNAKIDAVITVFETGNPDNILFSGKYVNVQGGGAMGYDFNTGYRISEAYAKLAKPFAGLIKKKTMK